MAMGLKVAGRIVSITPGGEAQGVRPRSRCGVVREESRGDGSIERTLRIFLERSLVPKRIPLLPGYQLSVVGRP
jgi:hypothetical protein